MPASFVEERPESRRSVERAIRETQASGKESSGSFSCCEGVQTVEIREQYLTK